MGPYCRRRGAVRPFDSGGIEQVDVPCHLSLRAQTLGNDVRCLFARVMEVTNAPGVHGQGPEAGGHSVIRWEHVNPDEPDSYVRMWEPPDDGLLHRTGALDTSRSGWRTQGEEAESGLVDVKVFLQWLDRMSQRSDTECFHGSCLYLCVAASDVTGLCTQTLKAAPAVGHLYRTLGDLTLLQ